MLPDKNRQHQPSNYCSYLNQLRTPPADVDVRYLPKNAAAEQLHNVRRLNEASALMHAVRNVDFRATCSLLNSGVDPNQIITIESGNSSSASPATTKFAPLHVASASGSPFATAIVDQLLRAGAQPNIPARGCDGITPLHIACLTGNHNILQLLLDSGGDPHQLDRCGRSPYACAIASKHEKCLSLLHAYDGRADPTPATPEKSRFKKSALTTPPHRGMQRRNSLTSISSGVSDYLSCVPGDEVMGGAVSRQEETGYPQPPPRPTSLFRRSDPQLDQIKATVETIMPAQTKSSTPVLTPSKHPMNIAFCAERYRVAPTAPLIDTESEYYKTVAKNLVATANTAATGDGSRKSKRVVGFRESTRGEFSLAEDPEFLDLCERVDRALRLRKRYEDNKKHSRQNSRDRNNAAAADSAIETDASVSNDEEHASHCMRYHRHHHHRHRSHSKDDKTHRSRSAGSTARTLTTPVTSLSSRRSMPLPVSATQHHRKSSKSRSKSKEHAKRTKSFEPIDDAAVLSTDAEIYANLTDETRDTAALYGYLACLNDRQIRHVLIRHGIHPNPTVAASTRFFYIRKLVTSLTAAESSSKNDELPTHDVPHRVSAQKPPSSFETPPKKEKKSATKSTSHYAIINPNTVANYADYFNRKATEPAHGFAVPAPPRTSPIKIHLPTAEHKTTSIFKHGTGHGDEQPDDVLQFCRELKSVLFNVLDHSEQQRIVDELQAAGQLSIGRKLEKKPTKGYFVYLLLDPRMLQRPLHTQTASLLSEDQKQFASFLRAIFYVGKGKRSRPMSHLVEARRRVRSAPDGDDVLNEDGGESGQKMQRICDIWRSGFGVVQIQCFHNCTEADAFNREAVMIEALIAAGGGASVTDGVEVIDGGWSRRKTITGNNNAFLTNAQRGSCYGDVKSSWPPVKKRLAGAVLLYKAYQIFCVEGESQLRASEIEN